MIADKDLHLTIKVTASIGCVPIVALFALDERGNRKSKLTGDKALYFSSLKEWKSITSLSCNLKKGMYLVAYGLKETSSGYLQVKLFASSMLKLFCRVCWNKEEKTLGENEKRETSHSRGGREQMPTAHVPDWFGGAFPGCEARR